MYGWLSVALIVGILIVVAFILVRAAARQWWDYLLTLAVVGLLFRPLYDVVGGDVSRYLPAFLWSADADGKDQIILASVASTLLLPVIVSAVVLLVAKRIIAICRQGSE